MKIVSIFFLIFLVSTEGMMDCQLSGADNEGRCNYELDATSTHCVWCVFGDGAGFCLSTVEADSVRQNTLDAKCTTYRSNKTVSSVRIVNGIVDMNVQTFATDDKNPYSDDQAPAWDDETPHTDDQSPQSDDLAPVTDDGTPAANDDQTPAPIDDVPAYDDVAPTTDDQAPEVDDGTPATDDETPASDDTTPASDDAAPASDDAAPASDDAAPASDDAAPASDDGSPVSDDKSPSTDDNAVPDGLWTCLQKKSSKECENDCTWCQTKAGFGICLTGDAAASASESSWFNCSTTDVMDQNVGISFLRSPSKMVTKESALYDPSCINAFLSDQTEEGCTSASDENGVTCQWCSIAGMTTVCLTTDQANIGSHVGISCDKNLQANDPYDPSCALAYLQDPTKDACLSTADADGTACEFCSIQDSFSICLNQEQASLIEQLGLDCDETNAISSVQDVGSPSDTSCALAYFHDPSEDACLTAVDEDGYSCDYCTLQGAVSICLTHEQSGLAQQMGFECDEGLSTSARVIDPYDTSCLLAYLTDPSEDSCVSAQDTDGNSCQFCSLEGSFSLCLNADQASISEQFGLSCDNTKVSGVNLPPDFLSCLENYKEGDCRHADCTWCNTEVGVGFCLANAAAEATKECSFFDCEFGVTSEIF